MNSWAKARAYLVWAIWRLIGTMWQPKSYQSHLKVFFENHNYNHVGLYLRWLWRAGRARVKPIQQVHACCIHNQNETGGLTKIGLVYEWIYIRSLSEGDIETQAILMSASLAKTPCSISASSSVLSSALSSALSRARSSPTASRTT